VWLETPGAALEPGIDQIPTTCNDFYTVQNFVRMESGDCAITLVPRDVPLMQLNEITTFQFRPRLPRFNGTVVAWLFNNYWNTNFPASQPGEHGFRFSLTSGTPRRQSMANSYRFAYEVANPLHACLVPQSPLVSPGEPTRGPRGSFVHIEPANVMLVSSGRPQSGSGAVLRLQEVEGRRTGVALNFGDVKPRRAVVTNLYEEDGRPIRVTGRRVALSLAPYAIATVRVDFD